MVDVIQPPIDFLPVRRRYWRVLVFVVLFAAGIARYWVSFDPGAFVQRDPESFGVAHSLYEEGAFASPFAALDTGPSAHLAPVFPAFLALMMRVFGDESAGFYAIKMAAALVVALQLALFPVFSRMLGIGEINGIIGALIWIAAKPQLVYGWESLYAAVPLAAACCLYRIYLAGPPRERRVQAWLLGGLAGLLILMLPTVAPVYAVWLAWDLWRQKRAWFRTSLLPLVLLPVLIVAPWTIRNYAVFHRLVLIRDDFGLELSVSNNDCAQFAIRANMQSGCFISSHPNRNIGEAQKVVELGEVGYSDLRLRDALDWIGSHPSAFVKLSAMRFIAFWMPTETFTIHYAGGRRLERVIIYLMTLLSLPGLVMLFRRDIASWAVILSCLTIFPIAYYVVQYEDRYRYPILWATFLLGAMPVSACARRLGEALRDYFL